MKKSICIYILILLFAPSIYGKQPLSEQTRVKGAPCFLNAIPVGCKLHKAEFVLRWWTFPAGSYYQPQLSNLTPFESNDFHWNISGCHSVKPIDMSFRKQNSKKDWFVGYTNVEGESVNCRLIYEVDDNDNIVAANLIFAEAQFYSSNNPYGDDIKWFGDAVKWAEEVYANGIPCTNWEKSKKGWYAHEMNYGGYIMIPQAYEYPDSTYFYIPLIKLVANKTVMSSVDIYPEPEFEEVRQDPIMKELFKALWLDAEIKRLKIIEDIAN